MRVLGEVIRFATWRQRAVGLLLVALFVRVLAPAGFMLDVSAAAGGVFKIVICTAGGGSKVVSLDATGNQAPDQPSAGHEQPCVFAGIVTNGDATHTYTIEKPRTDGVAPVLPGRHALVPPARAGPVLGSRAPPAFS